MSTSSLRCVSFIVKRLGCTRIKVYCEQNVATIKMEIQNLAEGQRTNLDPSLQRFLINVECETELFIDDRPYVLANNGSAKMENVVGVQY